MSITTKLPTKLQNNKLPANSIYSYQVIAEHDEMNAAVQQTRNQDIHPNGINADISALAIDYIQAKDIFHGSNIAHHPSETNGFHPMEM